MIRLLANSTSNRTVAPLSIHRREIQEPRHRFLLTHDALPHVLTRPPSSTSAPCICQQASQRKKWLWAMDTRPSLMWTSGGDFNDPLRTDFLKFRARPADCVPDRLMSPHAIQPPFQR